MNEQTPSGAIAAPLRDNLSRYAALVRELAGGHAKSLTLYGAAAAPSFDPRIESAASVIVLDRVELEMLRALAEQGVILGRLGIRAPLIMTPKYIDATLDTFPLEFIEIQQQYVVVFGEDHFAGLTFEPAHVRLECEREIKTMLIGMRQGLLSATGRETDLAQLELDVGRGLLRTLRGVLWLKGQRQFVSAPAAMEKVETEVGRPLPGVREALDLKGPHGGREFDRLYLDLEALGEWVNAW